MTNKALVAVIGLGNIGKVVAANLAKSNRIFLAAERNIDKATAFAATLGSIAHPTDIDTAVKEAEILILAIPFEAIAAFFTHYEAQLNGKIIIDPSNPIAPDLNGGFAKVIGKDASAGAINAAALPAGAKLAKALGTLGAASLAAAAFTTPGRKVLFYATDDESIEVAIEQLINDLGFVAARAGGINQSIRLEVFGDLHEFGALGKTVTIEEAKEKL